MRHILRTKSYRKHVVRVLTECCFKQKALKYDDTSIKSTSYRQFCCSVSLISTTSSANIPVSLRFFREYDIDHHFEKPLSPSSTQLSKNPRWWGAQKKIARRTSVYGMSSCNGLKFAIQIRSGRGTGKCLLLLPAEDEFEKQQRLS